MKGEQGGVRLVLNKSTRNKGSVFVRVDADNVARMYHHDGATYSDDPLVLDVNPDDNVSLRAKVRETMQDLRAQVLAG